MKSYVVLPNLLTASSLCCGLFVIFKVNMINPGEAFFEQVQFCVLLLLLAAFLDVLDGALARAIHSESEFGSFFDSMADSVSFGIAPAVLVLKTLSVFPGTILSMVLTGGAMIFALAGVLRLVRYSTTPPSSDPALKGYFTGIPITVSSMAVVSPTLLLAHSGLQGELGYNDTFRCIVAVCVFCLLAYLMVSTLKFISLKSINFKVVSLKQLIPVALILSIAFFLAFHHFALILFLGSWGYIFAAWTLALIKRKEEKQNL